MISVKINTVYVAAVITSPWWLDPLTKASTTAGLLLPIIGVVVGLVQFYRLLRK